MITLHHEKETNLERNGYGSLDHHIIAPEVFWEMNGEFKLTFEYPMFGALEDIINNLVNRNLVRAPVPYMDDQLFRIYRTQEVLGYMRVEARHVFYDLLDNLIEDTNIVGKDGLGALTQLLGATQYPHKFKGFSDINSRTNMRIVRYNPVTALLDDSEDNSFVNRWGGEIYRDNFNIYMRTRLGSNKGVRIEHKKDLLGYEATIDDSTIATRIMPIGFDGLLLPEKYIDSPLLDPDNPKIRIVRYDDVKAAIGDYTDYEDAIPLSEAYAELRRLAREEFSVHHVDEPETIINVDFVTLENTKEYESFKELQEIHQGDTVRISVPDQGFEITSRLVAFTSNPLLENHYTSTTLGNHVLEYTTSRTEIDIIRKEIKNTNELAVIARQAANGKNSNFWGTVDPNTLELNAQIDDTYFHEDGDYFAIWKYVEVNGERYWRKGPNTDFGKEIANQLKEAIADVELAQQTADEAVYEINTAIQNAGFTSLDDTIQNMNYITMNAEQSAQQAITNASNAYGLAQTSISEAQTAQANSLTALGKADNALDGVSNLDIRVDDVEAELELKADNTFMNEDGTLTTLSNAITFNAHRSRSDMSRIESRVESLVGEINLVVLRDAFKGTRLLGGEVYPNATPYSQSNTMREMINVTPGEKLAFSKESSSSGYNWFTINYYDENYVYKNLLHTQSNQQVITIPPGIYKMWVAYPAGSKPQIIRGTQFVPYRPNIADQMTIDEMVLFRNEYDEYADRTERRLSAIDSTGGSLDILNNRIVTTAEQVTTDMTALISTKVGEDEFTEFYQNEYLETAQEVSRKISLSDIKIGGRNLLKNTSPNEVTSLNEREYFLASPLSVGYYKVSFEARASVPTNASVYINDNTGRNRIRQRNFPSVSLTTGFKRFEVEIEIYEADGVSIDNISLRVRSAGINITDKFMKLEKGNVATGWERAPEDEDAKIAHIETEWTQTFDAFSQTVTGIDGRVTAQKQTIDSINSTVSGHGDRISTVEQTADGLQSTVAGKASQTQVTQLSTLLNSTVTTVDGHETQISQLADNINLRVAKGELLTQINLEAGRTLIQSDRLLINANNTVITGTAWMDGAVIANASIDGAKIQDATIGSAKIANLDASKISTGTLKSISIDSVTITGSSITGTVITSNHPTDGSLTRITSGLMEVWNDTNNKTGSIGVGYGVANPNISGVAINLEYGKEFQIRRRTAAGASTFNQLIGMNWNLAQFDIRLTTSLHGNNLLAVGRIETDKGIGLNSSNLNGVNRLDFHSGTYVTGGIIPVTNSNIGLFSSGFLPLGVGNHVDGTTEIMRVQSNMVQLYQNIQMNRNNIEHVAGLGFRNASAEIGRLSNVTGTNDLGVYSAGSLMLGVHGGNNYATTMRLSRALVTVYTNLSMNGNTITNQSDERLKRDIKDSEIDSLSAIESWRLVGYNWKDNDMNGRLGRQMGVIAQNTPELAMYDSETDTWSINCSKQIMMNTHAIQQLAQRELNTNQVASQALQATETNAQKIKRLEERIEELEGAA